MYGSFLFVPFSFDPVLIYSSTYSAIFPGELLTDLVLSYTQYTGMYTYVCM